MTTAVVAGPPDELDASSPAGGEVITVITADEGHARVNGESEMASPTDASDEHVVVVSSPGMCLTPHDPTTTLMQNAPGRRLDVSNFRGILHRASYSHSA